MSEILNDKDKKCIAILAGSGKLPQLVYENAKINNWEGCIIKFEGFSEYYNYSWNTFQYPIGKVGSIITKLKDQKIKNIIICGAIERGKISNFSTDFKGIQLLSIVAFKGDDGAIKIISSFLENEGFKIFQLSDFIKNSTTPMGHFAGPKINKTIKDDISKGIKILQIMSNADVGQSLVVQKGLVLAIEAIEGTDKMIKRVADYKFSGTGPVLIKFSKIGQEMKIDQPVIGPNTIKLAKKSNFSCIACETSNVLIVDFDKTLDIANKEEISLFGFNKEI